MTRHYVKYDDEYNLIEFKETYNDETVIIKRYDKYGHMCYSYNNGTIIRFNLTDGGTIVEKIFCDGSWEKNWFKNKAMIQPEYISYNSSLNSYIHRVCIDDTQYTKILIIGVAEYNKQIIDNNKKLRQIAINAETWEKETEKFRKLDETAPINYGEF